MCVLIAAARPGDLQKVVRLAADFYREDGFNTPAELLAPRLARLASTVGARVAVARTADGEVVGFAVTTTVFGLEDGLVGELQDLYVVPDHRGHGCGQRLVSDALVWAESVGAAVVDVVMVAGAPAGLDTFYERSGFRNDGRRLRTWRA